MIPQFTEVWTAPRTTTPFEALAWHLNAAANQHPLVYLTFGVIYFAIIVALPVWTVAALFGTYRALDPIPLPRAILPATLCILGAGLLLPLLALFDYAG